MSHPHSGNAASPPLDPGSCSEFLAVCTALSLLWEGQSRGPFCRWQGRGWGLGRLAELANNRERPGSPAARKRVFHEMEEKLMTRSPRPEPFAAFAGLLDSLVFSRHSVLGALPSSPRLAAAMSDGAEIAPVTGAWFVKSVLQTRNSSDFRWRLGVLVSGDLGQGPSCPRGG